MASNGVREGVKYLNSLTSHRFTALFRFGGENLESLYFFDRENPGAESIDTIPIVSSYCVYVRASGETFCTDDSISDARVAGHPKRQSIQAYCGVPLVDRDGKMFGTVCHFDVKPVKTEQAQIDVLEGVADVLLYRVNHAA